MQLNEEFIGVQPGDCILIRSGTRHAIFRQILAPVAGASSMPVTLELSYDPLKRGLPVVLIINHWRWTSSGRNMLLRQAMSNVEAGSGRIKKLFGFDGSKKFPFA